MATCRSTYHGQSPQEEHIDMQQSTTLSFHAASPASILITLYEHRISNAHHAHIKECCRLHTLDISLIPSYHFLIPYTVKNPW